MRIWKLLAGAVLALMLPAAALAASPIENQNVVLAKDDNRTGTYFASGQTVTIDGNVNGDVICFGQNIIINGTVSGDVLCAGQTVTVNGPVTGSVRVGGQLVTVNGTVGRNISVGAQDFVLGSGAKVSGDVLAGGQTVKLDAPIAGAVYVGTQFLELNSKIGGNLTATVENFDLGASAEVSGNVDYTSSASFALNKDQIKGQVVRHSPSAPAARMQPTASDKFAMLMYWLTASLVGMLLAIWLAPRMMRSVTSEMLKRWGSSLGWGALVLFAGPFALIVLGITVIGLPSMAVLATLWIIAICSSGIFAGVALGRLAWQHKDDSPKALALAGAAGVPLVVVAGWLPWLGVLVGLGMSIWTLGGMSLALVKARKA